MLFEWSSRASFWPSSPTWKVHCVLGLHDVMLNLRWVPCFWKMVFFSLYGNERCCILPNSGTLTLVAHRHTHRIGPSRRLIHPTRLIFTHKLKQSEEEKRVNFVSIFSPLAFPTMPRLWCFPTNNSQVLLLSVDDEARDCDRKLFSGCRTRLLSWRRGLCCRVTPAILEIGPARRWDRARHGARSKSRKLHQPDPIQSHSPLVGFGIPLLKHSSK